MAIIDSETLMKWALITALMGGTNAAQYLGITKPEVASAAEVTANNDFIRDELGICMAELRECYKQCRESGNAHGYIPLTKPPSP